MFKFHPERVNFDEPLGAGSFGEVFPYQKNSQDLKWVVKCVFAKNTDELLSSIQEIVLGFACDHPCVVPVKGYFLKKVESSKAVQLYLKIPRMKESLSKNFQERKMINNPFTQEEIIKHFYSLACGLRYLHSKKIYHGDLRHENLLLDELNNLKIGDVGIAKHVEDEDFYQTLMGQIGLPLYTAPEIFGERVKKNTLPKADIWSLGVVILELCIFEYKLLHRITQLSEGELQAKIDGLLGRLQTRYPASLKSLIRRMLSLNPNDRPSLDEIKSELEKNFSQILAKNLLDQDIQEVLKVFELEKRQLQETIARLNSDLQQSLERIEIVEDSKNKERLKSEMKMQVLQEKTWDMEQKINQLKGGYQKQEETKNPQRSSQQFSNLQRENGLFKQTIMDLQKNVNNTRRSYENQSIRFSQELGQKGRLEPKNCRASASFVKYFDGDSVKKLNQVISQLDVKWGKIFTLSAQGNILFLRADKSYKGSITSEHMISLSEELAIMLQENDITNLFGLDLNFKCRLSLKDEALTSLAGLISTQPLEYLTLNLSNASGITRTGLEKFILSIEPSLQNISQPQIFFNPSSISDFEKESIQKKFAHISGFGFIMKPLFASMP